MGRENSVLSKENHIFSLAKKSRYLPNVFLAIILIIVVLFGMSYILVLTPLYGIGGNIARWGLKGQIP